VQPLSLRQGLRAVTIDLTVLAWRFIQANVEKTNLAH
jgi:hypothetical protein